MNNIERIKELTQKAEEKYYLVEIKAAHNIFLECESLALETGDLEWIAESKKNLGRTFHRLGKYKEAKEKYLEAIEIIKSLNLKAKMPKYLNHYASLCLFLDEFEESFKILNEGLKLAKSLNDGYSMAKISNSLGVYYEYLGDYDKALEYMKDSLKFFETKENKITLMKTYNLISSVKIKLGEINDVENYIDNAYNLALSTNDLTNKAHSLINKIDLLFNLEKFNEIEKYISELVLSEEKIENIQLKSEIQRKIGQLYYKNKNFDKAINSYKKSLKTSKEINFNYGIAKVYELLGAIHYDLRNYIKAYNFYSKSIEAYEKILKKIFDPQLKKYYMLKFERLPKIIEAVNAILIEHSSEIDSNELESIPKKSIDICKRIHDEKIDNILAENCKKNTSDLSDTKKKIKEKRDRIRKEWLSILSEICFLKLNEDTQDLLIRYKQVLIDSPWDFESCLNKISNAIETEIKSKLFEEFRSYWIEEVRYEFSNQSLTNTSKFFKFSFIKLIGFLEKDIFLTLKDLNNILCIIANINSEQFKLYNQYVTPFKLFRNFIGEQNIIHIDKIIQFLNSKFKCGEEYYDFFAIRNSISHGGKKQEKRRGIKIKLTEKIIQDIEKKLVNEDLKLLTNLCEIIIKY